jgi:ubiquinone/menaquinone biosynthesis C-methylase UbiE
MRRVLKPGGRLLFCEHGLAPDPSVQRWQARITPAWMRLGGGCHLNRDIPGLLQRSGFRPQSIETGYMPHAPRLVGFHYIGSAVPA